MARIVSSSIPVVRNSARVWSSPITPRAPKRAPARVVADSMMWRRVLGRLSPDATPATAARNRLSTSGGRASFTNPNLLRGAASSYAGAVTDSGNPPSAAGREAGEAGGPPDPIRVFLLDDHEVVRRGLRDLLEAAGGIEVVGEAGTADEALRRIPPTRPDVAILDVRLPDGDGVEVCREVRSSHPEIQCLILTSFSDDEALFQAIMAGAAGYLLKQVRGTDLVDAIRRVSVGQSLLDPAVTARVLERLRTPPEDDERLARLTEQERRILDLIAEGLTNRQIAQRIHLAEKTVKNYVSNLLAKLGMERRTQAAVYAAGLKDRDRHQS